MSKQITLSNVREWTENADLTINQARGVIAGQPELMPPLGLLADCYPWLTAILQNAPDECVQCFMDKGWYTPSVMRSPHYTYRLHPDVELIDDTAPESEYEFVKVDWINGAWRFWWNAELRLITEAPAYGSICIQAEDAEKRLCYIVAWDGQNTTWPFKTINDLIKRQGCFLPDSPLTPKAVVFRQRSHGSEK